MIFCRTVTIPAKH